MELCGWPLGEDDCALVKGDTQQATIANRRYRVLIGINQYLGKDPLYRQTRQSTQIRHEISCAISPYKNVKKQTLCQCKTLCTLRLDNISLKVYNDVMDAPYVRCRFALPGSTLLRAALYLNDDSLVLKGCTGVDINTLTENNMTPIDFAKGLLTQLSTLGISSLNVNINEDKVGLLAVHAVIEKTVDGIKGNEAKSPRYRELLRIKNCLQPGVLNQFSGFCHSLFEAMVSLRTITNQTKGFPVTPKDAPLILEKYSAADLLIVKAAANAYMLAVKKAA
jgi:hypothetical protein